MIKNIFLDRDGVINEIIMRDSVVGSPRNYEEFKVRKDFIEFYDVVKELPLKLFIISNQPDISRNLMKESELNKITGYLNFAFHFYDIAYCTHDDSDNCFCRKPKSGLLEDLLKKHDLRINESIMVGDSWKDIVAGKGIGMKTVLLRNSNTFPQDIEPDYSVNSLTEILGLNL